MNDETHCESDEDRFTTLFDEIMTCQFTEQQRRILDLIMRLSYGCGKEEACIPVQKDFSIVGIREPHIKHHLDWLIKMKVISRDYRFYKINPEFDKWRVSKSLFFDPERLEDLIELNLKDREELLKDLEHQLDLLGYPRILRRYLD